MFAAVSVGGLAECIVLEMHPRQQAEGAVDSSMEKWTYNETFLFLMNVRPRVCLWDPRHPDYYNESLRRAVIVDVIGKMKVPWMTMEIFIAKLSSIRQNYHAELMKKDLNSEYRSPFYWYKCVDTFMQEAARTPEWISAPKQVGRKSNWSLAGFALDNWSAYTELSSHRQRKFRQSVQEIMNKLLDEQQGYS